MADLALTRTGPAVGVRRPTSAPPRDHQGALFERQSSRQGQGGVTGESQFSSDAAGPFGLCSCIGRSSHQIAQLVAGAR
jgi:hypothetical protein